MNEDKKNKAIEAIRQVANELKILYLVYGVRLNIEDMDGIEGLDEIEVNSPKYGDTEEKIKFR